SPSGSAARSRISRYASRMTRAKSGIALPRLAGPDLLAGRRRTAPLRRPAPPRGRARESGGVLRRIFGAAQQVLSHGGLAHASVHLSVVAREPAGIRLAVQDPEIGHPDDP